MLFLLIGILAGWIAGKLIQGGGFGLIGNMVVGVVGAVLGGYVLGAAGIDLGGFFGQLVTAVLGALILLFGVGLVKRA
ncbi:MAG: GlsB/YeaQ/YmgE family stress response membrane protein [Geminicoccaceae bacterium]